MRAPLAALSVLSAAALAAAGCGSSAGPGVASRTAEGAAAARPPAVSVLGTSVVLDAARARLALALRQPEGVDPPLARVATLDLPEGVRWRGGDAPSCARATLARTGVAGCPRAAVIGRGTAVAAADTATTRGAITVVNGGADHVLLATVVRHPAYVKTVIDGRVGAGPGGRLRLTLAFPAGLQTVAGLPLGLERLAVVLDRGRALRVAPCPARPWAYAASVRFVDGAAVAARGRVTCRG
ncbi:MAG TPA: hypothetical protein VFG42_24265 [Baekduia sp.]|uniref:hypothetical protein n=1 Tax=Baekduia sp. TaxID=2600305 RepID=UPI002D78709B|nr:hypothetical protein [Baekduia sp.]HET6509930.1 hypothetical protein [Baekduia sp.]